MKQVYCIKNCGRERCNPLYELRMLTLDGYEIKRVNMVKDIPKGKGIVRCPGYFYDGKKNDGGK